MDICDKKNQIQDLLTEIYNEYNRMNETKIQSKCETDLEMRTMISNIRSLESSGVEKDNRIKCLEKTVYDYEKIIEDLNSKLELKEECDRENNRHDMLRTLSKDISEKDREINRLNGLLEFHKKTKEKSKKEVKKDIEDNSQLESIIDSVSNKTDKNDNLTLKEVDEPINKETGEENPNFVYDNIREPEPSPDGSIHSSGYLNETIEPKEEPKQEIEPELKEEPKPESEPELKEESKENPKTLMRVKTKGVHYFVYKEDDPIQDVYEYNEDKRTDKLVGKRTRVNGKWSWKLF
tara:strand:+ start:134 stop:1012 length:879 start_codon:yes stop_codon:yes gene_type:complete